MGTFLTDEEVTALQSSGLSRETPYVIQGVSHGQLSIARHYGGIRYQTREYTYIYQTDELIRNDVLKWVTKRRKSMQSSAPEQPDLDIGEAVG